MLIQEYSAVQRSGNVDFFDCVGNDRLKNAYSSLQWAKKNLSNTGTEPWPEEFPHPLPNPELLSDYQVTDELFLCSLGWIVHHEIAHIVLQHPLLTTNLSIQEEKAADRYATNWLLSNIDDNFTLATKRAFGIAVAVLCLQSIELSANSCLRNTHPSAHDRIFNNLTGYVSSNDEAIEAFTIVVLQYLFHDIDIDVDLNDDSFNSIFDNILIDISRK